VRNYCESYGLSGGIAEYGCILVNRIEGRVESLHSREAQEELGRCRQILGTLPGTHIDPGYRAIVRAYRYEGRHWLGMRREDVQEILRVPLIGVIPESESVLQASNSGEPVIHAEGQDVAEAYRDVIARFLGEERPMRFLQAEKKSLLKRLFGG